MGIGDNTPISEGRRGPDILLGEEVGMKRKLLAVLLSSALGLTFLYNIDSKMGYVFTNDAAYDGTFIIDNVRNRCELYTSAGEHGALTAVQCYDALKGKMPKDNPDSVLSVIVPPSFFNDK